MASSIDPEIADAFARMPARPTAPASIELFKGDLRVGLRRTETAKLDLVDWRVTRTPRTSAGSGR